MSLPLATLALVATAWLPLSHLPTPAPSLKRCAVLPPPLMCEGKSEAALLDELTPSINRKRRWTANELGLVQEATPYCLGQDSVCECV